MARKPKTYNPSTFADFRGGDLGVDIVELVGRALDAVKSVGGQAVVGITLTVKTNKRGTAIEVIDKVKIKKPLPGETEKYEETIMPQRLSFAVALEDPGQQELPSD